MKDNGKVDSETGLAYKNGQMVLIIKVNGILVLLKEMVHFFIVMARNIKGIGQTIWQMEKEHFIMKMEIYMKDNF